MMLSVIRRYFEYRGYQVTYVRNITDIDDKIINAAQAEGCSTRELSSRFTEAYCQDMATLGVRPANHEPKATEHIPQIIAMIVSLIQRGYAYVAEGSVYFEVGKFAGYGKLSGRKTEDMIAGARVEVDKRKRHPLDFALWKAHKPGEPYWECPWGRGRPGWHIECSAMSTHFLGDTFDIHGGGKDLIFPHHENEIAQSEGASGKPFARYWLHNGFVTVNREKMSKSLGNFFTIREILAKYDPEVLRLFLLSTHYRSPIDFSDDKLEEAKRALERFYNTLHNIERTLNQPGESPGNTELETELKSKIDQSKQQFVGHMDDDFNTAAALGAMFDLAREINVFLQKVKPGCGCNVLKDARDRLVKLGDILTLGKEFKKRVAIRRSMAIPDHIIKKLREIRAWASEVTGVNLKEPLDPQDPIADIIFFRDTARAGKKWAVADEIRQRLAALGIQLEDHPQTGTAWRLKH